jgi:hypothetical protein
MTSCHGYLATASERNSSELLDLSKSNINAVSLVQVSSCIGPLGEQAKNVSYPVQISFSTVFVYKIFPFVVTLDK